MRYLTDWKYKGQLPIKQAKHSIAQKEERRELKKGLVGTGRPRAGLRTGRKEPEEVKGLEKETTVKG